MAGKPNYATELRALGRALEILRIDRFEIQADGHSYLVQVAAERPASRGDHGPSAEKTLRYIWASAPDDSGDLVDTDLLYAMAKTLDLHYSPEDVIRMEREWRAERTGSSGSADPASLSELLRTTGGYIEGKGAYLSNIRRHGGALTIRYQTESGEERQETLEDADIYQESLRMLSRRKNYFGPN